MSNQHTPWKPDVDVLGKTKGFRPVEDLIYVIQPYRITTKQRAYTVLQPTVRSVKITTNAINKMMLAAD